MKQDTYDALKASMALGAEGGRAMERFARLLERDMRNGDAARMRDGGWTARAGGSY